MKPKIAFVNMPFSSASNPAIGISLLQAALQQQGVECHLHYLNLRFASAMGFDTYDNFAHFAPPQLLAGEWVFAKPLFCDGLLHDKKYLVDILLESSPSFFSFEDVLGLIQMREYAEDFLEDCLDTIDWSKYGLIGFTSTFHQNTASLALAKKLKQAFPEVLIAFGGGNCEGEMGIELQRQFPFIDFVCSGEGDRNFPEAVKRLLKGDSIVGMDGIIARKNGETIVPSKLVAPVFDLDSLPIPKYDDLFRQFKEAGFGAQARTLVPIETSRGCWWGAKMHCSFCGLNGSAMMYRSKSPQRALEEIVLLSERYGTYFLCVDTILDLRYIDGLFPEIALRKQPYSFHYETKVNLKKSQLKLLRDAGVRSLQPGIESLSTSILRLMRKGCSLLQNLQFLKWCQELGIRVAWNLLYGFPGEDPAEYASMVRLLPSLMHLEPPVFCGRMRLDRYSPYFMSPGEHGITNVRAHRAYSYIYPYAGSTLTNLAYYFEFDHELKRHVKAYTAELVKCTTRWQNEEHRGELVGVADPVAVRIVDTRSGLAATDVILHEPLRTLYLYCDEIRSFGSVRDQLREQFGDSTLTESELRESLQKLVENRLMVSEGLSYLSLAVLSSVAEASNNLEQSALASAVA